MGLVVTTEVKVNLNGYDLMKVANEWKENLMRFNDLSKLNALTPGELSYLRSHYFYLRSHYNELFREHVEEDVIKHGIIKVNGIKDDLYRLYTDLMLKVGNVESGVKGKFFATLYWRWQYFKIRRRKIGVKLG